MKRLVILISGGGSNMQAVIDACKEGRIKARVVAVVSSNAQAGGLEKAAKHGIAAYVCALSDFESPQERDKKIVEIAAKHNADYLILAGYLGIFTPDLVGAYKGKIINIHPSLLPKHGGKGFYGTNVHKSVLASGDKVSGATAHLVDENIDTGAILAQKEVEVMSGDTPESLQKRVLEIEHLLLVEVLAELCREF